MWARHPPSTDAYAALAEIITEFDNLRYGTGVRRVDQKWASN
jgi:hypothetical protein